MMRKLGIILASLFMLTVAAVSAPAQTLGTANVTGTVTDPSGAVVPGADVGLIETSTNQAYSTQTNKSGRYQFSGVRVGFYTVTAQAKGFRKAAITNAKLEVGKDFTFDFSLEVGAATEIVEVRATVGAELQTLNSTMGVSLSGAGMLNMPSGDRDV